MPDFRPTHCSVDRPPAFLRESSHSPETVPVFLFPPPAFRSPPEGHRHTVASRCKKHPTFAEKSPAFVRKSPIFRAHPPFLCIFDKINSREIAARKIMRILAYRSVSCHSMGSSRHVSAPPFGADTPARNAPQPPLDGVTAGQNRKRHRSRKSCARLRSPQRTKPLPTS